MRAPRITHVLLLAAVVATGLLPATAAEASRSVRNCTDRSDTAVPTQSRLGLSGLYALPARTPTQLTVFAHGYGKTATGFWGGHLRDAAKHGAVGVAMDYRGIGVAPGNRGWNVSAGAADSIAAAQYFLRLCPTIQQVFLLGVSMGGNASGLAVAAGAKRPDGTPLFDYWIDIEGATNVTETYLEASALAPANEYAAGAQADIEQEMGGTLAEAPDRYREESVVNRGADIAASGIKGVVLVHGFDDGLVPFNQSREMEAVLAANGIPTDFFAIGTRGDGEAGTTATGYAGGPVGDGVGQPYESPFAGHGAEESTTQLVIKTGFEQLWGLMAGTATIGPHREFLVDGDTGISLPPQAA
jgi:hypothetical protein